VRSSKSQIHLQPSFQWSSH